MLTHCVDEQRSMQPQTPAARRVAAARAHLLRCASSEMEGIAFVGTPRIWPRGARNAAHATFASGCLVLKRALDRQSGLPDGCTPCHVQRLTVGIAEGAIPRAFPGDDLPDRLTD